MIQAKQLVTTRTFLVQLIIENMKFMRNKFCHLIQLQNEVIAAGICRILWEGSKKSFKGKIRETDKVYRVINLSCRRILDSFRMFSCYHNWFT